MPLKRSRVLLADDHALILAGVAKLLSADFDLVGEVHDGRALVEAARAQQPDAIVVDIGMPQLNGIEAVRQIMGELPQTRVVFLTQQLESTYVRSAFQVGARGYVAKQSASTELRDAIQAVLQGKLYVTPLALERSPGLLERLDATQNPSALLGGRLTARQREVLQLISEGKSVKEIAAALYISAKTAEFHKAAIMDELGVRTTAELTRYALASGIATP